MTSGMREQIESLIGDLSPEEAIDLIELIANHVRPKPTKGAGRATLEGYLAGKLPLEIDLEAEIRKIRESWKERLLDGFQQ